MKYQIEIATILALAFMMFGVWWIIVYAPAFEQCFEDGSCKQKSIYDLWKWQYGK